MAGNAVGVGVDVGVGVAVGVGVGVAVAVAVAVAVGAEVGVGVAVDVDVAVAVAVTVAVNVGLGFDGDGEGSVRRQPTSRARSRITATGNPHRTPEQPLLDALAAFAGSSLQLWRLLLGIIMHPRTYPPPYSSPQALRVNRHQGARVADGTAAAIWQRFLITGSSCWPTPHRHRSLR
jgi:hypothetical protein